MEVLFKLEEEREVPDIGMVLDFDPAQFPCGMLARYFYELLAKLT
jgi:hypothetical protein